MTQTIHRISFTLDFPAGLAPGENASGNELTIARDGQKKPILRGSALAGVLRSLWRNHLKRQVANPNTVCDTDPEVTLYFGVAPTSENDAWQESHLRVPDCVLDLGGEEEVVRRTHHQRCRHTGRVMDGALFSLEACPPKTKCRVTLWLEETNMHQKGDAEEFLATLLGLLSRGAIFGGNGNRGVGLAVVDGDYAYRPYDLSSLEDYAAYLDDDRAVRQGDTPGGTARLPQMAAKLDTLRVEFTLAVPPGQDILIGDGQGLEAQAQPQRVKAADGRDYWRLPGASLRGCFRDWITHLAAKEGKLVADSCERYEKDGPATGDALGWLFAEENDPEIHSEYPVADLFGSLHKAGRLHVADAYSMVSSPAKDTLELSEMCAETQYRPHVALDAITGGAVEHFFFDDIVLTQPRPFHVTMLLRSPSENDAKWLAAALDALNRGQIRIGSSKSAGRLVLTESPKAVGLYAEWFEMLEPYADSPADPTVEDMAATDPGTASASESFADSASSGRPGFITGVVHVSLAKKGNKIIKIEYQRPDKNKTTLVDYTSLASKARGFNESDAENGDPVHIFLDDGNQLERIIIPGKAEITLSGRSGVVASGNKTPVDTNKLAKGPASLLGRPFHNPYVFIPFPEGTIARGKPTPRTADERSDSDRFTGILELEITTISPLLTMLSQPKNSGDESGHQVHEALTVGADVIVPATSVRGFLRYLTTILTGGPLTLLDDSLFLCQGRDAQLGPRGTKDNKPPKEVFLARVVRPGDANRAGVVELGRTILKKKDFLEEHFGNLDDYRPKAGGGLKHLWARLDSENNVVEVAENSQNGRLPWQVKLSGRPVNTKNIKREGLFLGEGKKGEITLPPQYWAEYSARNHHGVRPELKKGDLVWLEPVDPELEQIRHFADVRSIQWARWGRHGQSIMDPKILPERIRPDYMRTDGHVSEVTDLFGLASSHSNYQDAPRFAGRVRPENLVFSAAKADLTAPIHLAVMSSPHPGCVPFYRKNTDVNAISTEDPLRGYKVYRTSLHAGIDDPLAPWRFENQGTYDAAGRIQDPTQKVNFTVPLLPDGQTGTLRIAVRALARKELALLVLACKATWRLGGGKPLGLGACRVRLARMVGENAEPVEPDISDDEIRRLLGPEVLARFHFWQASQRPVETMRYPRLVNRNKNKNSRGGLVWFQQCAQPKAVPYEQGKTQGVRPIYVCDGLKDAVRATGVDNSKLGEDVDLIAGQMLPPFDPENPAADLLYGYDCIFVDSIFVDGQSGDNADLKRLEAKTLYFNTKHNTQNCRPAVEPFDEEKHITGREAGGENTSQNWKTRQYQKDNREQEG